MDLGPPRRRVEKEIAQLARVRLHVDSALPRARVTLQNEDLVLRAALFLEGVHCAGQAGRAGPGRSRRGSREAAGSVWERQRGVSDIMTLQEEEKERIGETKGAWRLGEGRGPWGDCELMDLGQ